MSNYETIPFNNCNTNTHKRRGKTPSFSSILLDAIYRSIDDTDGDTGTGAGDPFAAGTPTSNNYDYSYNYSAKSKQRRSKMRSDSTFETLNLGHAIMIESWMESRQEQQLQQSQPYDHYGNNVDDHDRNNNMIRTVRQKSVPSRSTLSDSSSTRNVSKIHTNFADSCFATTKRETSSRIFTKTKSRAMKIYGDLKTIKPNKSPQNNNQPISPGARIAAFLNSIFRNSGDRKPNPPPPAPATTSTSTCSSASSFSRSCLSKTTSSRGKSSSSSTRSVRFYPVSVIVDEDSRPCGQKSLRREEERTNLRRESHRNEQSKGRREKEIDALMAMMMIKRNCREREERELGANSDDDDDDGESCASSDLFELENLSSIGVSRYAEELPVYATTSLHKLKG